MSEPSFNPDRKEDDFSEAEHEDKKEMPESINSYSEERGDVGQILQKKKQAAAEQCEFIEVNRWDSTSNSNEDIWFSFARILMI